jgi:hypothetical protein
MGMEQTDGRRTGRKYFKGNDVFHTIWVNGMQEILT